MPPLTLLPQTTSHCTVLLLARRQKVSRSSQHLPLVQRQLRFPLLRLPQRRYPLLRQLQHPHLSRLRCPSRPEISRFSKLTRHRLITPHLRFWNSVRPTLAPIRSRELTSRSEEHTSELK